MTRTSIRELGESWRPRYLRASRKEKVRILDEFVALTGSLTNRRFVSYVAVSVPEIWIAGDARAGTPRT